MKNYEQFVNERMDNISYDDIIDIYMNFIRILKLHEKYYYDSIKISNDPSFKKKVSEIFNRVKEGKGRTEDLYNLINEYENKLHGDEKITPSENNFGCSIWDVCEVLIEDNEILNINKFIQDFDKNDIYLDSTFGSDVDISDTIEKLDKKIDNNIGFVEKMVDKAFEISKDRYDDINDIEEIEVIDFAIDIIKTYKDEYPEYLNDWENEIEELEELKNRWFR